MAGHAEIGRLLGPRPAGVPSPEDWSDIEVSGLPSKDPLAYARYWFRRAERAQQQAYELEERALIAEQRCEDQRERADAAEQHAANLHDGLTSRATIDQAKGVIMGAFGLGADPAFDVLVWVSQQSNLKVKIIAERFLAHVRALDLGDQPREELTRALAVLAGVDTTWES